MNFTAPELSETANELRKEINRFLSKQAKPDVLLGTHPTVAFASQLQRIASWHVGRIESRLAGWINKVPNWTAKGGERFLIAGATYELDNLAWNSQLNIVLAVEAKRTWANQDNRSKAEVKRKHRLYTDPRATRIITSHVGQTGGDFRYFVFDVYGKTETGNNGLPIIAGDKISRVFDRTLACYVEWERQIMANAMFEMIDPRFQDLTRTQHLENEILSGSYSEANTSRQSILDYIDQHAR